MSVQVENLEKNMVKLTIEVPAEELEKAIDAAYKKQKNQISIPGFRKGKVPRAMVEKMYGQQLRRAVLISYPVHPSMLYRLRKESLSSTQLRLQ